MNNFTRNFLTEWRKLKLPFADETFVVAVSGGADSVSLLLAVNELKRQKKLNLRFVVAHLNHVLRGEESDRDEQFVKELAEKFEFELALKKEKVLEEGNLEQEARIARYDFLSEIARNLNACGVLTAHTQNDQAETFLLNLIRGSGLEGLGGMKAVRNLEAKVQNSKLKAQDSETKVSVSITEESEIQNPKPEIFLVRPLLNWAKREDTENFCRQNQIEFRYDTMNEDLAFKRVRIRKVLLPLLKDFNPQIVETLAQTASLLRDDFDSLKTFSGFATPVSVKIEENLKLKDLKDLFPSIRQSVLRDWIKRMRGDLRGLEKHHFTAIENLIFSRKSGRKAELPNGEFVLKERGNLIFVKSKG